MHVAGSRYLLLVVLLAVGLFIFLTGQSLPAVVAAHFGASGRADGFMPRNAYVLTMLAVAIGMPVAIVLLQALVSLRPRSLNIRHRDYWLAPERREATLAYVNAQVTRLAALVAVLVGVVHGLVIDANAAPEPRLDPVLFYSTLAIFTAGVIAFAIAFHRRFRR